MDNADGFADFTLAGIVGGEVADELHAVVAAGTDWAAGFRVGEDAVAESEPAGSPTCVVIRPLVEHAGDARGRLGS